MPRSTEKRTRNDIFHPIGLKWGVEVLLLLEEGASGHTHIMLSLGIAPGQCTNILYALKNQKLVFKTKENKWKLTKKGKKALSHIKGLKELDNQ